MDIENIGLCGEFQRIIADMESDNMVSNAAGVNRASVLIAGGNLPNPVLLLRLVTGLASNLSKSHHDIDIKIAAHSTLVAIRAFIIRNVCMDPSVRNNTLHAIQSCLMNEEFRRIQRHGGSVRLWEEDRQLSAVRIICMFFRRSPMNIIDARCVIAFASLMLSTYDTVMHACIVALLSLPSIVPSFVFAVAKSYCNQVMGLPPQSFRQISNVLVMFERLKHISLPMVDQPGFSDMAMDVLQALENKNLVLRRKVLNLVVSLLTPLNIDNVLLILRNKLEMAASADTPFEYYQMLERAIRDCHFAYPDRIMPFIRDPKYIAFVDCIHYIKDIVDKNLMICAQLLKGFLMVLRHVRSSPVCSAIVWGISVCCVHELEDQGAIVAITSLFKDLLDQRKIEKLINDGAEVQHDYTLHNNPNSAKEGDAHGMHEEHKMEMEELLFVHLGLAQQVNGGYAIASSSKSIADHDEFESLFMALELERTDNLARVVGSGDPLLADFVLDVLSRLMEMGTE
ncbi:hypothetical protein EJB05_56741, partial [Eragrostis curvula]